MTPLQKAAYDRDKVVYAYLLDLVAAGKPMLTQGALGAALGMTRSYAEDCVKRLRRAGIVRIDRRGNAYRVTINGKSSAWSVEIEQPSTLSEDMPRARNDQAFRSCLSKLSTKCEGVVFGGPGQRRCTPCDRIARDMETPFDSNPGGGGRRVSPRSAAAVIKTVGGSPAAVSTTAV